MSENKNGFANLMDKLAESAKESKAKREDAVDLNILPLPDNQLIGDGILVWQWSLFGGTAMIEAAITVREPNQLGLAEDQYVVSMKLHTVEDGAYVFDGDAAKELGQALTSAWNWKSIWKLHAGELLFKAMQQPPAVAPAVTPAPAEEIVEPEIEPEVLDQNGREIL